MYHQANGILPPSSRKMSSNGFATVVQEELPSNGELNNLAKLSLVSVICRGWDWATAWVVVIIWTQILDPGRWILHHLIVPPGFNLDCRRWLMQSIFASAISEC
jgi:hypothetical protein